MSKPDMPTCTACSAELPEGAVFCVSCGARTGGEPAPVTSAVQTLGGLHTLPPSQVPADQPEVETLEPGTVIGGKFRIESLIGYDALGAAYQATEIVSGGPALLKLLQSSDGFDQVAYDQMVQDIAAARRIAHPGVAKIYDTGRYGQAAYIAMEQVSGEPLQAWISRQLAGANTIPRDVAVSIIAEIANSLEAAHTAGVIHGQLQPSSIVLTREPDASHASVKIADFGFGRLTGEAMASGSGTGHGGAYYRAPEMVRHAGAATPATDVYSLSIILYELLVGVVPTGHWQPPSAGRDDIPARIDDLIKRGLSTSMALRPQSAAAYRMELLDPAARNVPKLVPPSTGRGGGSILKWTGIAFMSLMGLATAGFIVEKLINDAGGTSPQTYTRTDPDPPPPPRPSNPYDYLNGQWLFYDGTPINVSIDRSGNLSGRGRDPESGATVNITGQLSGRTGTLTLSSRDMGMTVNGRMLWDGLCHINYQLVDPQSGMTVMQDQFHINHPPGQTTCP